MSFISVYIAANVWNVCCVNGVNVLNFKGLGSCSWEQAKYKKQLKEIITKLYAYVWYVSERNMSIQFSDSKLVH